MEMLFSYKTFKTSLYLIICLTVLSCKKKTPDTADTSSETPIVSEVTIEYAQGFSIKKTKTYQEITVSSPWPGTTTTYTYITYPKNQKKPVHNNPNAIFIPVPVERLIATSTTDIPKIEALSSEDKIVGFPHTDYISSPKTRMRIEEKKISDIGNESAINTELAMELSPDLIIGFSATGDTKAYDLLETLGIPVIYNGSWMEQHPLGRSEWIKFIAAFLDKENEASLIFENIKKEYLLAKKKAAQATNSPSVLYGSMYKDIWYAPGGNSYKAQLLKDANTTYIWADDSTSGSLQLSFETALEKGMNADIWVGPLHAPTLTDLSHKNDKYTLFHAFKNESVYSSSLIKGKTGGTIFYELGSLQPDLILKDLIKIAHPQLLENYELTFFKKLDN
ncbi:ABC transporter substrate-binding protein [Aquimarina hainanensis]|uniref:ABC transporter substrate-binding protein n=1 Tax=Aquimarina hainanensis TaxID=1578017 RepID=A0ABW5N8V3_9FLAO